MWNVWRRRTTGRKPPLRARRRPLAVEPLEGRQMMATLSNVSLGQDGSVVLNVDAYGAFGFSMGGVGAGVLTFDPVGAQPARNIVNTSAVALGIGTSTPRTWFSSGASLGPGVTPSGAAINISGDGLSATSNFTVSSLEIDLRQTLGVTMNGPTRIGSIFTQVYSIRNTASTSVSIDLHRYLDADLNYSSLFVDGGGRLMFGGGDEILFLTDEPTTAPGSDPTFVGITGLSRFSVGNSQPASNRFEVSGDAGLNELITNRTGPLLDDVVGDGADVDEYIDASEDLDALVAKRNVFTLAAGQSIVYVTHTIFGTPPATLPMPGLIIGTVFRDDNSNGSQGGLEPGLSDMQVYLDLDTDGVKDANEPDTLTSANGEYVFAVAAGTYQVRQALPAGSDLVPVAPAGGVHSVTVATGQTVTGRNFADHLQTQLIQLTGLGQPIAPGQTVASTSNGTDFGATTIVIGSVNRTFTIRNDGPGGGDALNLTGTPRVQVTGDNAADFVVTQPSVSTLAAGASTTFGITFNPQAGATGVRVAMVSIACDDANRSPYTFTLRGNALANTDLIPPSVGSLAFNSLLVDPADLEKGEQPTSWVEQRSSVRSIVVQFTETVNLHASHVELEYVGMDGASVAPIAIPPANLSFDGDTLTIVFPNGLPFDGGYRLRLKDDITDPAGNAFNGDGNGIPGGDYEALFHQLEADFNGDRTVDIFDIETLTYWFFNEAPSYVNLDEDLDNMVDVFDVPDMAGNFFATVTLPGGASLLSGAPGLLMAPTALAALPSPPEVDEFSSSPAAYGAAWANYQAMLWISTWCDDQL